jgi:hypothetical protein
MNRIEVIKKKTKYIDVDHLVILIDSKQLDEFLDGYYPGRHLLGLVPAFLDWSELVDKERTIIRERAKKEPGTTIVPILLCPDDFDLWCTVIVAEVQITNNTVIWNRMGIDSTNPDLLFKDINNIGHTVEWLLKVDKFIFDKNDYMKCIEMFFN